MLFSISDNPMNTLFMDKVVDNMDNPSRIIHITTTYAYNHH